MKFIIKRLTPCLERTILLLPIWEGVTPPLYENTTHAQHCGS